MLFATDLQTINDLGLIGRPGTNSVFTIYNRTSTSGGAALLEDLFRHPLSDAEDINRRSQLIRYFGEQLTELPFDNKLLDAAQQYMADRDERTRLSAQQRSLSSKLSDLISADPKYKIIVNGISALGCLLQQLWSFIQSDTATSCAVYQHQRLEIMDLLSNEELVHLLHRDMSSRPSEQQLAGDDSLLRFRHAKTVEKLLQYIYYLDVYISLGKVALERQFCFARAECYKQTSPVSDTHLKLTGVWHPAIDGARGNDIQIDSRRNLVFLTGANMAGKSTFMKSLGIAVYLAHCGFPVAAINMEFTVMEGLFSTINLPDNLGMGASHFYAEVLRLKKVARELHAGRRIFVLFDELFRGTNVKDAGDATVAVVKGFAKRVDSLFVISTHIIEAAEILQAETNQIQYQYLPTIMQGHTPEYTYQLTEGVTKDRHGMVIIRNEGILEILKTGLY